jgi:hypothetical protein
MADPLVFIVAEGAGYCDPATGQCVAPAADAAGKAYELVVDPLVVDALVVDAPAEDALGGPVDGASHR